MTPLDKILRARSILVLDHPFFGSLALRLDLVEDSRFETAAVNGKEIHYNPEFIEELSPRETVGLMAHEVMHLALGHGWRKGERESRRWFTATDLAINENLIAAGFTLPKGAFIDPTYKALSAEEIYEKLPQQEKENKDEKKDDSRKEDEGKKGGEGKGKKKEDKKKKKKDKKKEDKAETSDPGRCGTTISTKDKKEEKELKIEWEAAVSQAVQVARGDLPANIKRQVQEVLNPTVPWHILLRDFVERTARNDYDWTRPSRRYIGQGIILPSLISEQLPEVVIAIDTSGSIDNKALSRFAAEASNVLGAYDTTIKIIYCNNRIQKEETYTRADLPMKMNPVGGGGTDFRPVFNHLKKQEPTCLIYFTDLYGRFPTQEPDYPIMWLTSTKEKKAPFGITVRFEN